MLLRITFVIILAISVLFMPFSVSVILGLVGIIYFNIFVEAVVLFFLSDLLYGIKESNNSPTIFLCFVVSIIILSVFEFFKKEFKFYN
ncbi:MAG: hypothetical protein WCP17_01710 [bacterium]